jgi:hypothetical protein
MPAIDEEVGVETSDVIETKTRFINGIIIRINKI